MELASLSGHTMPGANNALNWVALIYCLALNWVSLIYYFALIILIYYSRKIGYTNWNIKVGIEIYFCMPHACIQSTEKMAVHVPIEVWRSLGDVAIVWLTKLFNHIFQSNKSNKMPEEWRKSILLPIFKNKGNIQNCTNYQIIKLMSHTMKLWERVIEHRLRRVTNVTKNQTIFMPGRLTT
jgi:hypothetical protein